MANSKRTAEMKARRRYIPVSGSHLSKDDAKKIGQGIELLFDKYGHTPQFVSKFAEAVKSPSNPAHPVVQKKYEELKGDAWRNAVQYCLRNVDVIEISIKGVESAPQKAFILLDMCEEPKTEVPEGERRELHTPDMVRNSPARLAVVEDIFRCEIQRLVTDFANLAGIDKAVRVVRDELDQLKRGAAA